MGIICSLHCLNSCLKRSLEISLSRDINHYLSVGPRGPIFELGDLWCYLRVQSLVSCLRVRDPEPCLKLRSSGSCVKVRARVWESSFRGLVLGSEVQCPGSSLEIRVRGLVWGSGALFFRYAIFCESVISKWKPKLPKTAYFGHHLPP